MPGKGKAGRGKTGEKKENKKNKEKKEKKAVITESKIPTAHSIFLQV